jgi:hypothetical protein
MIGGGVRFYWRSMAPLWLGFPGGDGDAEVTALQRITLVEYDKCSPLLSTMLLRKRKML